jgi:hypothetical protein
MENQDRSMARVLAISLRRFCLRPLIGVGCGTAFFLARLLEEGQLLSGFLAPILTVLENMFAAIRGLTHKTHGLLPELVTA